jgi:hypothetical protein
LLPISDSIKNLSEDGLYLLYQDATSRIGSHVAGGNVVDEYVEKQRALIVAIEEELSRRQKQNKINQ